LRSGFARATEAIVQHSPSPQEQAPQTLMQRIDRLAGEMNAYLLVFAIGLAVLDLTCLVTFAAIDNVRPAIETGAAAQAGTLQVPLLASPIGR
jgi:hypothetical protein